MNCSSDLKNFANSRTSASNFKSFSRSQEQFFLTVGQSNFGNKIPFLALEYCLLKTYQNIDFRVDNKFFPRLNKYSFAQF